MSTTFAVKSIDDILDLLAQMEASPNEALRKHAETLQGPRSRGSTTKAGLAVLAGSHVRFSELHAHAAVAEGCTAYLLDLTEVQQEVLDPRQGASPVDVVLPHYDMAVREEAHGPELFIDR